MIDINPDTYAKNCLHTVNVVKKNNKLVLWIKMHILQEKLGVKNMSDLTIKAIKGIYDAETSIKKQIR